MKKAISLFIVVLLCLTLNACARAPEKKTEVTKEEVATETVGPEEEETEAPTPVLEAAPETPAPEVAPEATAPSGIPWDEASNYIGERTTVYGPVVSTHYASTSKGQPTFLNIGKPYPDPGRFTVVIWGQNRDNFSSPPEDYYDGKTIYVTGLVTEYEGIPQIEVKSPNQIEER